MIKKHEGFEVSKFKVYIGESTGAGPQKVMVNECSRIKDVDSGELTSYELPLEPSLKLWNHSPDGFQWGYQGSGPAQLALAILLDLTDDPNYSVAAHQEFKRAIIATAGKKFVITEPEIRDWMKKAA